jgi:PGF-CTERM protein
MSRALVSAVILTVVVAGAAHSLAGTAAADDVTVEITAVDENGQPVDGVGLAVTWDDGDGDGGPRTATTSADGRALVDVPEGSTVAIETDDDEYVRNRPYRVFDVGSGEEVQVRVSEIGRAKIVVEGASGRIPDATVSVRDPVGEIDRQTTNGSGVARTDPVELGEYTVRVTAPGHLQRGASIGITRVEKTHTVTVRRADVDATVTVVDDHFDPPRPVEGATVRIEGRDTTLTTGSDGTATLSVPVNRNYDVRVDKDGYDAGRIRIGVGEDPVSREVTIRRSPALSIESVNRRVVVGESTVVTVTDEYDRRVEGAAVSVGGETVGRTDEQGQLRVPIDEAGEVTIGASDGEATATVTVESVNPSATETPTATPTATPGEEGPGFGAIVAALGMLAAGLLARRTG